MDNALFPSFEQNLQEEDSEWEAQTGSTDVSDYEEDSELSDYSESGDEARRIRARSHHFAAQQPN